MSETIDTGTDERHEMSACGIRDDHRAHRFARDGWSQPCPGVPDRPWDAGFSTPRPRCMPPGGPTDAPPEYLTSEGDTMNERTAGDCPNDEHMLVTCHVCNGSGVTEDHDGDVPCSRCDGRGHLHEEVQPVSTDMPEVAWIARKGIPLTLAETKTLCDALDTATTERDEARAALDRIRAAAQRMEDDGHVGIAAVIKGAIGRSANR